MHERFRFKSKDELLGKARELGLSIPFNDDLSPLLQQAKINDKQIDNRLVVQPMEGYDSEADGSPSPLTERRYLRYGSGGSGIIWFEAIAVTHSGQSNPRQLMIHKNNYREYKILIDKIRRSAPENIRPFIVAQITHSGRYSKPDGKSSPLVPCNNSLFDKGNERVLSDNELVDIQNQFIETSRFVYEAGFDAVDIKACHGYLVHELLFSFNRKNSIYGGLEPEKRFRFLLETVERIKTKTPDILITTRLSIGDIHEGGFATTADGKDYDLTEPVKLTWELKKMGIKFMNITMGNPYYNPYVSRPFDNPLPGMSTPPEHPLKGVTRMVEGTSVLQKNFPDILMIGSAYSWLRQFAPNVGAAVINSGSASFIGFGRNSFAYPSMPLDLMTKGYVDPSRFCITCSGCTRLIRNMRPGGCVTRDREIYAAELKKLITDGK
ncbi:MAG TPA: hypothetical protein PLN06_06760 [Bacteroidales bacterium]|nr:hypothetical protein [Bacteroidales bacterium]